MTEYKGFRFTIPTALRQKIIRLHDKGMPATDIAVRVRVSRPSVVKVLASFGKDPIQRERGCPKGSRHNRIREIEPKIISMYRSEEFNLRELATKLNVSMRTIRSVLERNEIRVIYRNSKKVRRRMQSRIDRARKLRKDGLSYSEIGKKFNSSKQYAYYLVNGDRRKRMEGG